MKVLGIGYGRHLLDKHNGEVARLEVCAAAVDSYDQIVFTYKSEGYSETAHQHGLTVHPTNSKSKTHLLIDAYKIGLKISKTRAGVDVVTAQDPFETGLVAYFLAKKLSVPLNVQEHTDVFSTRYWRTESLMNRLRYLVGTQVIKRADTVRVVSERIKRAVVQKFANEAKIRYLPVAIATNNFYFFKHQPSETFTYISVARFVKQKNLILLVEAFFEAYTINPKLRLVLVGKGPERHKIGATIQTFFPAQSPISIVDWSDDVPALFQKADAYVLSSNYEGWGRVLVEARVSGLPVVTTDVGCVGEVILDGVHGLVVPVADKQKLTEALVKLSTNLSLYKTICTQLESTAEVPGTDMSEYGKKWMRCLR